MENSITNAVESTEKITYQFTKIPTNLFILLDNNSRSMLFTLIQLSSFYSNNDGYFFRTNADLSEESNLSQKLVTATVDTLYSKGLIEIRTVGKSKGKQANYYKINFYKFTEFEKYTKDELKNPLFKIETVNYKAKGYSPSYLTNVSPNFPKVPTKLVQDFPKDFPEISPTFPKVPTNIDSIDNIENKDNIYNKGNLENEQNDKTSNVTLSMGEYKQVNSPQETKVVIPTIEEINNKILADIELYFKPSNYNSKGLTWYEVINTIQHHANEIRSYILTNITDIELKNTYCSTVNRLCDDVCDEIKANYTNKDVA